MPESGESKDLVDLSAKARALGVDLDERMLGRLAAFEALLGIWSRKINLTAIRDPAGIRVQHFLDCLAVVPHLGRVGGSLLDVGAGAGLPGMICAIARPDLQVTLVERRQRKAAFLMSLRRELDLPCEIIAADVAQVVGPFDVVISRATFPPRRWLEVGSPLVRPGGQLIAMLSTHEPELDPPPGFDASFDSTVDLGAGPRRIRGWTRPGEVVG